MAHHQVNAAHLRQTDEGQRLLGRGRDGPLHEHVPPRVQRVGRHLVVQMGRQIHGDHVQPPLVEQLAVIRVAGDVEAADRPCACRCGGLGHPDQFHLRVREVAHHPHVVQAHRAHADNRHADRPARDCGYGHTSPSSTTTSLTESTTSMTARAKVSSSSWLKDGCTGSESTWRAAASASGSACCP
jgi:hypothetical protein